MKSRANNIADHAVSHSAEGIAGFYFIGMVLSAHPEIGCPPQTARCAELILGRWAC